MNRKEAITLLTSLSELVDQTSSYPDFVDSDNTFKKIEKSLKVILKLNNLSRQEVWSLIYMVNLVGDALDGFWSILSTIIEYHPAWPFDEEQLLLVSSNNDYMDELKYMAIFSGGKVVNSRSVDALYGLVGDHVEEYQDSIDIEFLTVEEARYILLAFGNRVQEENITEIKINPSLQQKVQELITDIKLTAIEKEGLFIL